MNCAPVLQIIVFCVSIVSLLRTTNVDATPHVRRITVALLIV